MPSLQLSKMRLPSGGVTIVFGAAVWPNKAGAKAAEATASDPAVRK
jgi:hypothetical protein